MLSMTKHSKNENGQTMSVVKWTWRNCPDKIHF